MRIRGPPLPPALARCCFCFFGVATCMRIMLAFNSTFEYQFVAFFGFIAGGSLGMFVALNWRYRSMAINIVSSLTPLLTFIAITSLFARPLRHSFSVTGATYGFATCRHAGARDHCLRHRHRHFLNSGRLSHYSPAGPFTNSNRSCFLPSRNKKAKLSLASSGPVPGRSLQVLRELSLIAQRLDHGQHFFERDKPSAVLQLVAVDRAGQFRRFRRQAHHSCWQIVAAQTPGHSPDDCSCGVQETYQEQWQTRTWSRISWARLVRQGRRAGVEPIR